MYNIVFYEDKNGFLELNDELMELAKKADNNKDARIQFKQITLYIELLKNQGTKMSPNITKHLEGEIWELRPGFNRVLYFYFENNTFVLLHMFRKKHKRHQKQKWKKHIKNVMIIKFEMEENNYENMGRFQKGC